jgi:methyl-accepting chemotaxis protein
MERLMSITPQSLSDLDATTRLRYMRMNTEMGDTLRRFWVRLEPVLPSILDGFYRHVGSVPALAALLGSQAGRLKQAQAKHWRMLFSGRFDDDYMRSAHTIGLMHNKIGLEPRWYIGGYNFILGEINRVAVRKSGFSRSRLATLITAIHTAVMVDMDLAISTYQDALVAEQNQRAGRDRRIADLSMAFERVLTEKVDAVDQASAAISRTAETMAERSQHSGSSSLALGDAVSITTERSTVAAETTRQLSQAVNEIARQVAQSSTISRNAVSEVTAMADVMRDLESAVTTIGEVVNLINDIASQTNLLALNATIEAARAGDAGKGFAVVAGEVKNLANQTAKATDDIGRQIAAVQDSTRIMGGSLDTVVGTIRSLDEASSTIASAVQEQEAATDAIAANLEDMAAQAQTVAGSVTSLAKSSSLSSAGTIRVIWSAKSLSAVVQDLHAEAARFVDGVRG